MAHILLAEDKPDVAEMLQLFLAQHGHTVDVVGDGRQAVTAHAATSPPYALVLLDAAMPRQDGYEAAEAIRRTDAATPILLLTAHKDELTSAHANHVGIDRVLFKPIAPAALLEAIEQLLRHARV